MRFHHVKVDFLDKNSGLELFAGIIYRAGKPLPPEVRVFGSSALFVSQFNDSMNCCAPDGLRFFAGTT
jgi:hypothetical protein